jgi:hypothetical protein
VKTEKMIEYFREKGFGVKHRVVHAGSYFTVAEARLVVGKKPQKLILYAEGIARRSHSQEPDKTIGRDLATNRAVSSLIKKFLRKNKAVHSWYMS